MASAACLVYGNGPANAFGCRRVTCVLHFEFRRGSWGLFCWVGWGAGGRLEAALVWGRKKKSSGSSGSSSEVSSTVRKTHPDHPDASYVVGSYGIPCIVNPTQVFLYYLWNQFDGCQQDIWGSQIGASKISGVCKPIGKVSARSVLKAMQNRSKISPRSVSGRVL